MARKIRFPLKMKNGAEVRTLEELRNNFDLESVLGYFMDGKLATWLRNYFYDDIADRIDALDKNTPDISKQLCEVLGAEYAENEDVALDEVKAKHEREKILKQLLTEEQMKCLATNQEDLENLYYDEGNVDTIFLAFGEFELLGIDNVNYIILKETNPKIIDIDSADDDNLELMMKYANQGIAVASSALGDYYNPLSDPTSIDEVQQLLRATKWYAKAVEQGNIDAQSVLNSTIDMLIRVDEWGDFIQNISYVNDMKNLAIGTLQFVAAETGDSEAQYMLGEYYKNIISNGDYSQDDITLALEWYTKSAEQDNAFAKLSLGEMYSLGIGVEEDDIKGLVWYRKAVENLIKAVENDNSDIAAINCLLAFIRETGDDVVVDVSESTNTEEGYTNYIVKLLSAAKELLVLLKTAEEEAAKEMKNNSDLL